VGGEVEVGEPTSLAVNYPITLADVSDDPETMNDLMSEDEIAALREAPADIVIANHVFHLLELAALHVSAEPAQLESAQLAIDAVAGILGALEGRLGERGALLGEGLAQVQLAFVRVASAPKS
jgi:hypothetical protein